jgi:hypothetical protein
MITLKMKIATCCLELTSSSDKFKIKFRTRDIFSTRSDSRALTLKLDHYDIPYFKQDYKSFIFVVVPIEQGNR